MPPSSDLTPAALLGDLQSQLGGRRIMMAAHPADPAACGLGSVSDAQPGALAPVAAAAAPLGPAELKELTGAAFNAVLPMKTERFGLARRIINGGRRGGGDVNT